MAERRAVIVGTGSCLPEREVTNAELSTRVDTSDDWIVERTGIRSRRIAAEGETTSMLATVAARHALEAAGVEAGEIGLTVVSSAERRGGVASVWTRRCRGTADKSNNKDRQRSMLQ